MGGRAADFVGRRRLFVLGIIVFTGASLACGLAPSSEFLIFARALQGLGAAMVSPAALSIVTTTFREGPERTKALSVWAAIAVGGAAIGLLLGVDAGDDFDVLLERGPPQLRAEALVDLEDPRAVRHVDLDAHRRVAAGDDLHGLDRVRGQRVDVLEARLERYARATPRHVERVGDPDDSRLDGKRRPLAAVADGCGEAPQSMKYGTRLSASTTRGSV